MWVARTFSTAQPDVESRVLKVVKAFERVDASKVRMATLLTPLTLLSNLRAAPLVRAKAKFTVKNAVCGKWKTRTYGVFDCEFHFHSHEWSCSHHWQNMLMRPRFSPWHELCLVVLNATDHDACCCVWIVLQALELGDCRGSSCKP